VPPSARKQGGISAPKASAAVTAVHEEDYDFCDHTVPPTSAPPARGPVAVVDAVYASDYMDSEEAFEEFLRKTSLEQSGRIEAVPFHAAMRVDGGRPGQNVSAMPAVGVAISDDLTDEEAARQALRAQLLRDQSRAQLNRFGILDEEDADNED
jgi:hypothetical protein